MSVPVPQFANISALRGLLIAVGIALWALIQPNSGSSHSPLALGIVIGVAMQLMWWLVLTLVRHYEQRTGLQGALRPIVVFVLELLIDAITVALFAHAVLQHWWQAGQAL